MKTVLLYIFFSLLFCDLQAQEKRFKNFEIKPFFEGWDEDTGELIFDESKMWILSPDFEQTFEAMKQEYREKGISMPKGMFMEMWLNHFLYAEIKITIPQTLEKRLQEHAPAKLDFSNDYFQVFAIADSTGLLSTAVLLDSAVLDCIKEDELELLYATARNHCCPQEKLVFVRLTQEIVDKMIALSEKESSSDEERRALLEEADRTKKRLNYGIISCYVMKYPHQQTP